MTCGIYGIINRINGKKYIGSSVNIERRWREHRSQLRRHVHPNCHLQNAWAKHGEHTFVFATLMQCQPDELLDHEQHCLNKMSPEYNQCRIAGNLLGMRHTEAAKEKISKAMKGKRYALGHHPTEDARRKMSLARVGNKYHAGCTASAETRRKMSEAHKGHMGFWTGKSMSVETRRKMSEAKKGKPHKPMSVETRRKISEAHKGKPLSVETRRKISEARTGKKRKPMSSYVRRKLLASHLGQPLSAETKSKISASLRARHMRGEFAKPNFSEVN